MPRPELILVALVCAAASAHAEPSDYGKVDTFQPGKKYNCVPTADRKGWDCKVTGNADVAPTPAPAQVPAASAPAGEAVPAATPTPPTPRAGDLPGYLTNAGASQPMQAMPAAPAPKPAPKPRVKGPLVPTQTPAAPAANPPPAPPQPAVATPTPAPAVAATPAPAGNDFLALPATQYVIELAHADSAAGLGAARAVTPPTHGEIYELHLSQSAKESWLLLWGPFADLPAARAARDELAARGATPGWPRRIGPLQTEAERSRP
ncbi:MAG: hypothetical protein JSS28_07225 [Proteobacteria bacterium]|nr:hypothetical protein [Pseudomonadota bacterium]